VRCDEKVWQQCRRCGKLVCPIHDEVHIVWHSGSSRKGSSKMCEACVNAAFANGELTQTYGGHEYINTR
jgi:hypothetical protein